jgi:hypothetical protein
VYSLLRLARLLGWYFRRYFLGAFLSPKAEPTKYSEVILDYGSGDTAESKIRSPLTEREAGSLFLHSPPFRLVE